MVKGHYLQFVAPAMAVLYGSYFEEARPRALVVANVLALAASLVYVIALIVA
jgi:hypothetical protein